MKRLHQEIASFVGSGVVIRKGRVIVGFNRENGKWSSADHFFKKQNAVMVYLTASPKTILKRVAGQKGQRPLLAVDDQLKTITDMLKFRKPYYERSADITINTSRLGIDGVVEEIIGNLKEYEGFNFKK